MGLIALTHSSRPVDREQCSLNFLTRRYSDPDRLTKVPPLKSLPPESKYQTYRGSISFFRFYRNTQAQINFCYIGSTKNKKKIQHAVLMSENSILVCFENALELWRFHNPIQETESFSSESYSLLRKFDHPHFAGLHTSCVISKDIAVISASAPDAVLILNLKTGKVEKTLRMPRDLYGHNYDLTPKTDLRAHYISNDYQTTHINMASPMGDGSRIVVSALIPGAVGIFDLETGNYRELCRGFIGCHGARVAENGLIYFADSVNGNLVFINEKGQIVNRFAVESRWLHDVQQINGDIYAFTLADRNELQIRNILTAQLLFKKKFMKCSLNILQRFFWFFPNWIGDSTQFISCYTTD